MGSSTSSSHEHTQEPSHESSPRVLLQLRLLLTSAARSSSSSHAASLVFFFAEPPPPPTAKPPPPPTAKPSPPPSLLFFHFSSSRTEGTNIEVPNLSVSESIAANESNLNALAWVDLISNPRDNYFGVTVFQTHYFKREPVLSSHNQHR